MANVSLIWSKHLPTEKERKDFQELVRHSRQVLGRLADILDEKSENIQREEVSLDNYSEPSWAYKQAHLNGKRAALTEVRSLLDFLDQRRT